MAKKLGPARDASPQPAEAVEGAVARASAASDSRRSERRFAELFEDIPEGFAYCRLLYDDEERPNDWLYLDVNPAFERITGLADVAGKQATDVFPTITHEAPELFDICGKVVASGEAVEFESDFTSLHRWLHVTLLRPEPGHFVALIGDMTSAKAAEEEVKTILRTTIDGYYLVDMDGRFLDTNDSYCQMIGHSREELLQMSVSDIEAIDTAEVVQKRIQRIMETGHDRFETRHRRKDGRVIDIEASVNVLEGRGKFVVFMRDITERKRAEAVLRTSRRDLVEAQRLARMGSWAYDSATQQPEWSEGMFRIWGLDPGCGAPPYSEQGKHIHPEDLQRLDDAVREAVEHGTPFEMDLRIRRPDGEARTIITTGEALCDAAGKVTSLRGTTQDITERKVAEEQLATVSRQWRQTFDAMSDSVALFDEEGRVLRCNAVTRAFTGRAYGDIVGRLCYEVFHGAHTYAADCPQRRAFESGHAETSLLEQDGRWLRITFEPEVDTSGHVCGGVHVVSDVSGLKETEERLRQSLAKQQRTTDGVIAALARSVEVRDPYTAGHQRRVGELAAAIARELGLDAETARRLEIAGMLHDVGKIVVPAEILAKPGRLSESEFALIKGHSQAAHEILASIEFDFPVAEIVLQHHERLDGSGYPAGLSGEEILPEARILAVADVVEAMITHRPYRAALPLHAAMAELEDGAGSRYDAAACEAAVRLFREQGFTFAE